MGHLFADPSHQLFAGFNAFFSSTWQKTRVEQVSLKVFHLWRILGHPSTAYQYVELMQEALPFCFSLPEEGQALAARMLPFLGIEQYEQILDISHINVCKAYHKVQELMSLGFSHFFFTFSLQKFLFFCFFCFLILSATY